MKKLQVSNKFAGRKEEDELQIFEEREKSNSERDGIDLLQIYTLCLQFNKSGDIIYWYSFNIKKEVNEMKEGIHPKYGSATVTCGCGNTFETGSVKSELRVDVCSNCHPFYTGQQRAAKARGRIEQFNKRYGKQ